MTTPDPSGSEPVSPLPAESHVVRHLVQGLTALVLVAAVIVAAIIVVSNHKVAGTHAAEGSGVPTPKNMASFGVLLTGDKGNIATVRTPAVAIGRSMPTDTAKYAKTVNIVEYIDYQCPICLEFEQANLNNTANLVADGKATLEIHPVSILDRSSQGTRYSSRAVNAAACVANFDPDEFLNVTAALYENQPSEGSTGLTNAQILALLADADVSSAAVSNCVNKETYREWVTATTNAELESKFTGVANNPTEFVGTPTVFVNGAQYTGSISDGAEFTAFVKAQSTR